MEHSALTDATAPIPKLFVATSDTVVVYDVTQTLSVGRTDGETRPDIAFVQNFVSRKHGVFAQDAAGCYYTDTNAVNGTFYNGKRLARGQKQYLKNGDVLNIFRSNTVVKDDVVSMIFSTLYPAQHVWEPLSLSRKVGEVSVVSTAKLASFVPCKEDWSITNCTGSSVISVNGVPLAQTQLLALGDCVRVANLHFVYLGSQLLYLRSLVPSTLAVTVSTVAQLAESNGAGAGFGVPADARFTGSPTGTPASFGTPADARFTGSPAGMPMGMTAGMGSSARPVGDGLKIDIINRTVWQHTKELTLLQDIKMTIQNGELVLILGGSGAGKTTFMNAVMGYEKANGKIIHNGVDIYKEFKTIKHEIGFVPQLDLLRGNDVVYDTLSNAAELKLSTGISEQARLARIEVVLETLGLQRERNALVSKLSGGQRKRLSIAVEYIADPSLFFLDEPDSGLDGIMSKTLMQNLRTIADEQKIVMVISHAPDRVATLFDKVIVLAKSVTDNCGHLAFFGSVDEAKGFFETTSLEGVVQRINRPDEGGDGLSDHYIQKYQQWVR